MRRTLVVMAKYPKPGRVKTRLAASVGPDDACELYVAFLRDLHRRCAGDAWSTVWAMSPPGSTLRDLLADSDIDSLDQRGADLGQRMHNAFVTLFESGSDRVVMIGADTPQLAASDVGAAFDALDRVDVVLTPSRDGGYCLIGLRAPHDLFSPVEMSTPEVLEQTRDLCRRRQLRLRLLPASFDIDELADVRRLATDLDAHPDLTATSAILSSWRRRGLL